MWGTCGSVLTKLAGQPPTTLWNYVCLFVWHKTVGLLDSIDLIPNSTRQGSLFELAKGYDWMGDNGMETTKYNKQNNPAAAKWSTAAKNFVILSRCIWMKRRRGSKTAESWLPRDSQWDQRKGKDHALYAQSISMELINIIIERCW